MQISIKTIKHADQDYETAGNFFKDALGETHVLVSEMGNENFEFLVALHELVEQKLCEVSGITDEAITAFDVEFEKNRKPGDTSEPGDDPRAPYRAEHCFATGIERLMCAALGVKWDDYEKAVLGLGGECVPSASS